MTEKQMLTRKEAAVFLCISVWTFDRWVDDEIVPEPVISLWRRKRWTLKQLKSVKKEVASNSIE